MENLVALSQVIKRQEPKSCPGCGHNIFIRVVQEVLVELGLVNRAVECDGVGCAGNHYPYLNHSRIPALPHGRTAAAATGLKRTSPELIVYTFQGDGDAEVIGLAETMGAAYRNENICAFISLNMLYGLTGGQMAWSTLPGQVTATSSAGRDCELTGYPFHFPELVAHSFPHVAYAARGAVDTPAHINQLKGMVRNALEAQAAGEGYSVVECLSMCPNNWHMSPVQCQDHISNVVTKEFPLGEFVSRRSK